MKRKRSKFENFFSLNQHRKRWGGSKHVATPTDIAALKTNILDGSPVQTRGSEKSLDQHLQNLRTEFAGQSELLWHHAKLVVLIRRDVSTRKTYQEFRTLWDTEYEFLCSALNIRWLVSATDTFAEHDPDVATRSVAMMTSMLANLIKMQESERYIVNAKAAQVDPDRVAHLQENLVPLFEGMSCFTVGTDDTLRNMRWRLEPFFKQGPAGYILETVWTRLQKEDTVFNRFGALHHRKKTQWWTE